MRRRSNRAGQYIVFFLILVLLAACGGKADDDGRSFAPEIRGDTALPTDTPAPTETSQAVNSQPNESQSGSDQAAALFAATGNLHVIAGGLTRVQVVPVDGKGAATIPDWSRSAALLASAAPDGSQILAIDRSNGHVVLRLYAIAAKKASEIPLANGGTPEASPASSTATIQTGDRIAWSPAGDRAVVSIAGAGVYLVGADGKTEVLPTPAGTSVTAVAWSLSGQSVAFGLWDAKRNGASLATMGLSSSARSLTQVLALADNDGRFVRSLVWGSEQVGLIFALRAATGTITAGNDLFNVVRVGQPMTLLASAGVAAPIAVVDQVGIAADGTTVAFTVLVPGDVGLRFHSLWVVDARNPSPVQADTAGIRRVSDMAWTDKGLVIVGTRRVLSNGNGYQITVVERVSGDAPQSIANDRSAATPVGSPVGSPEAATPAG